MSIRCILGSTLKKLMHARVVSDGGDFSLHTVFTEEDFAAAALQGIDRRQCLDWARRMYDKYTNGDERKLYFLMNKLSDEEVCNQSLLYFFVKFNLLHLASVKQPP
jgi:hypothetical protein